MPSLKSLALSTAIVLVASVAQAQEFGEPAPPATPELTVSPSVEAPKPLTFAQQNARFQAEQAMMRMQWNKWIGHDPARPFVNASFMSNGFQRYYIPSRGLIVTGGNVRTWYW